MNTITISGHPDDFYFLPRVAKLLKTRLRTVQRLRAELEIGRQVGRGDYLLTPAEFKKIRAAFRAKRPPGNPNFKPGHKLPGPGRGKKKSENADK